MQWQYENPVAISAGAGQMATAARGVTGDESPAAMLAVLMLSSQIDGWNFRRALVDAQDIAHEVATRLVENARAENVC
jgi:hypothetical protein